MDPSFYTDTGAAPPPPKQDTGFGWSDLGVGLLGLKFPAFAKSYYEQKDAQRDRELNKGLLADYSDQATAIYGNDAQTSSDAITRELMVEDGLSPLQAANTNVIDDTGLLGQAKQGSREYENMLQNKRMLQSGLPDFIKQSMTNTNQRQQSDWARANEAAKPYSPHYFTQGVLGQDDRTQNAMLNKDGSVTTFGETQKKGSTGVTINNSQGQDGVQWMTPEQKAILGHKPEDKVYYHRTTGAPTLYDPRAPAPRLKAIASAEASRTAYNNVESSLYDAKGRLKFDPQGFGFGVASAVEGMTGAPLIMEDKFTAMFNSFDIALEAYLRNESGAAITKEDMATAKSMFRPVWGEKAPMVAQRMRALKNYGNKLRREAGQNVGAEPASPAGGMLDFSNLTNEELHAIVNGGKRK